MKLYFFQMGLSLVGFEKAEFNYILQERTCDEPRHICEGSKATGSQIKVHYNM